jgi:hypothetical protein
VNQQRVFDIFLNDRCSRSAVLGLDTRGDSLYLAELVRHEHPIPTVAILPGFDNPRLLPAQFILNKCLLKGIEGFVKQPLFYVECQGYNLKNLLLCFFIKSLHGVE